MTTVTNGELKRLEDFLIGLDRKMEARFDKLEQRFDKLEAKVQQLEVQGGKIEAKVDGLEKRIDGLDKRIDETNARINTLTLGFLSIVGVLVAGILGIFGKIAFFPSV